MPRPVGWRTATIEEIAEKVGMGPFGSSIKVETFVPEGIPIISGQHLHGARLDEDPGFKHISPEHAQRLVNSNVFRGDIVLTHRGTLGQVALIPDASKFERYIVSQSQFYIRCDRSKVDPEFVTLYLKSPEGQHQLLANSSQVGVPSIAQPVTYLRSIEIPIPPLPEQHDIAHVLGTLDDKIELNRRMNRTLEEMARAIFQDWFVDFGPTRAKMEGLDPYLPPELWDLFPDELVDSELGEIPEGWDVKPVGDCISLERGLSYKGSGLASKGIPMHNLNSVHEGGGYKNNGIKFYKGEFKDRHVTRPDDVIVPNTEQGHDRLLIGFAAIVPKRFGEYGLFSHHIFRIRPQNSSGLSPDFICHLLNTRAMHDTVSGYATGTTVNMLPADALRLPITVVPPERVIDVFSRISKTARTRQEKFIQESQVLTEQRDNLIPKLVSGDFRIS